MLTKTWQLAERTTHIKPSVIREILKLTQRPNIISFAGGLPSPDAFPLEHIGAASQRVLEKYGTSALQYSTTEGFPQLREWVASTVSSRGRATVTPDQVLITSGSQQALDLIGKVFLDPGSLVAVESPTYMGALQAWNAYQAQYTTMDMDEDGVMLESLEAALKKSPRFAYLLPNYQNPSGLMLSAERRQEAAKMAQRYGVPLLEDDAYAGLTFDGNIPPTLHGYAPDNTIYVGTFSKTLAPGLRLAWIVADKSLMSKLVETKQGTDLHTSSYGQLLAYECLEGGFLAEHSRFISSLYGERCARMLSGMDKHFPQEVTWTRPTGGMFIWVTLPEHMSAQKLFEVALEQEVAFVPGTPFFANGGGENTMRLNFSSSSLEKIDIGIERLGKAIRAAM